MRYEHDLEKESLVWPRDTDSRYLYLLELSSFTRTSILTLLASLKNFLKALSFVNNR